MSEQRAYVEKGRAQEVLKGMEDGSVQLFSFSPPYLDAVDYQRSAEKGDNRFAWDDPANKERIPEEHRAASGKEGSEGGEEAVENKVARYVDEHLQVCRQIKRVGARDCTVVVEIDDYRVDGEFRLVGLVDLWQRMLKSIGLRIAEKITLGRKIAVSRRGAQLMRDDGNYQRPGYFAPANVTSTLLVGMRGNVQERLRQDGGEQEGFSKEWAKKHMKSLWMLQPPGEDRMDRKGHPCPQSLRVARAAVRFYSTCGDMVCDPYAGEGTTGVAALEEGRRTSLIEPIGEFVETARQKVRGVTGESPGRIEKNGSIVVPGAQLRLPMVGGDIKRKIEEETYPGNGQPTERHEEMAEEVAEMIGMEVPPALVSTFLRAERSVVRKRKKRREG